MRKLSIMLALLVAAMIAVGVTSDDPATRASPAPVVAGNTYSPEALGRASAMTQQMSVDGPVSGHEYHPHSSDEQLRLSRSEGFTRELESYQSQIDKMLARTP